MSNRDNNNLEEGLLANDSLQQDQNQVRDENVIADSSPETEKTLASVKWQVFALVLSLQANAFIMMSILPYIAFMCISLVPGLNEQNAGSYAGAMTSVSMVGKACSSYAWGKVADKYGRKAVFFYSYLLTILFSILFGLSSSIKMAFITRFFLGASNNNMLVIKTMCSELACGDRKFEGKLMGFVMGSRGWISLYGPLISGFLAEPVKQFPNSWISTTFHDFLTTYPFILPNLAGVAICIAGMISTHLFIPETQTVEMRNRRGSEVTMQSIWKKPKARDHVVGLWLVSFLAIFAAEATPLFFVATEGGLSLQENLIGIVLTATGIVYVLFQFVTYKTMQDSLGVYGTLLISSIFGTPLLIFMPISLLLNIGQAPNTLSVAAFLYVVLLQGVRRIFGSIFMSTISLASNRSVERNEVAVMNALSMLGFSLINSFSPIISGISTSLSLTSDLFSPTVGIYLLFGAVSVFGFVITFYVFFRLKQYHVDVEENITTEQEINTGENDSNKVNLSYADVVVKGEGKVAIDASN